MRPTIKQRLRNLKKHLTSLDDQPLGQAALIVVIVLDLFILTSIFDGLDRHTAQLNKPDDSVPGICREIVIGRDWNAANRLERLSIRTEAQATSYYRRPDEKKELHSTCAPIVQALERIKSDQALVNDLRALHQLAREARDTRAQIERIRGPYDTALLAAVAKQPKGRAGVEALQREIETKTVALNGLAHRLGALEASLAGNAQIRRLWTQIDELSETRRQQLGDDLRSLNFWYPVKRLGMELVFLLPLVVAFYLWNSASLRHGRSVQTLVSSHLLVVTAIPVLLKVTELIYDIIPKKLLQRLIEVLESLKLVALWHYLLIALAIAGAVAAIYLFQKKLFSREKLLERRIARGQCQQCGRALPAASAVCSFCGFAQFRQCAQCGRPSYVYAKFCKECGTGQPAADAPAYP